MIPAQFCCRISAILITLPSFFRNLSYFSKLTVVLPSSITFPNSNMFSNPQWCFQVNCSYMESLHTLGHFTPGQYDMNWPIIYEP